MTESLDIERRLALPPKECFALWIDPQKVQAWWGPRDEKGEVFRSEIIRWDVREGESWSINMTAPDGTVYRQGGEMIEVDPPRLIRFSFHWIENDERGPTTEINVRFEPDGDGTRLCFQHGGFDDADNRDGHHEGWSQCLDRFDEAVERWKSAA